MFNEIMMSQLGIKAKSIRQELLENLAKADKPLTNIELAEMTSTWYTARNFSIELVQMQKNGLAYIESFDESTYPKRGRWALTEKGRAVLAEQMKGIAA